MSEVNARELGRWLVVAVSVVSALGLGAELSQHELFVEKLSLSYEGNVPTWLASVLLFSSAIVYETFPRRRRLPRARLRRIRARTQIRRAS